MGRFLFSLFLITFYNPRQLKAFLQRDDFRILEAVSGFQTIKTAQTKSQNLTLAALNLPKLNGIEALEQIRQFEKLNKIPIVTNSSSGKFGRDLFLNAENLGDGYVDYIPKPFNLDYLLELIETILLKTKKAQ